MSLPMEYVTAASAAVSAAGVAIGQLVAPEYAPLIGVLAFIGTYAVYSYSPLPQGPSQPGHLGRKPSWGFVPEQEERSQRKLTDYTDSEQ